jgi:branched-chain amino acid aminotransferase
MSGSSWLTSVDGIVSPTTEAVLPLPDDGLFRGDGVFEVVRSYSGRLFAFTEHLDRLEASAAAIELGVNREAVTDEAKALLAQVPEPDCLLRIVVTRSGRRILALEPLPSHAPSIGLATVTYSPTVILDRVKSLSYAANMQATRIAKRTGFEEALLVNPEGIVLEPPTSSLFWVSRHGSLRTTDVAAGVLDSITRRRIIERCEVETGLFAIEDVLDAEEAFLASTTREVQPVHAIDGSSIPTSPAPFTSNAAKAFQLALEDDLNRGTGP